MMYVIKNVINLKKKGEFCECLKNDVKKLEERLESVPFTKCDRGNGDKKSNQKVPSPSVHNFGKFYQLAEGGLLGGFLNTIVEKGTFFGKKFFSKKSEITGNQIVNIVFICIFKVIGKFNRKKRFSKIKLGGVECAKRRIPCI